MRLPLHSLALISGVFLITTAIAHEASHRSKVRNENLMVSTGKLRMSYSWITAND